MEITVQLPDNIAQRQNPGRDALEALVIQGFSSGALSAYEARTLLGIDNRFDFDAFVKEHNIEGGSYGMPEYEQDLRTLAKLEEERRKKRSA
jgi:hypothetical protein